MKKIFTLLAVAAVAMTTMAEVTFCPIVSPTKEQVKKGEDGKEMTDSLGNPVMETVAVNISADTIIVDNEYLTAKTVYAAKTGIKNEYVYNLNVADAAATPEMTPAFADWFEFRSKKPAEGVWPPEQDGSNRTPILLEMKQAATIYAFVRTGTNKNISLYGTDCVEVTRTSQGYDVDPNSESNGFFVAKWENLPAGNYVLTESGGTGRFSGMAYEVAGGGDTPVDPSGIDEINADVNAPVEYFNLQGIRVANPENGLFIRRQGKNVSKVIL